MPACGPVRLIAPTPRAWRAIDTRVALWCSPVASRTSSSRGSGSSVIAAARPRSSSVVSPMADTTTTRSLPAARSRAMRRATRLIRSASATDDPPNFWTTSVAGMAGAFYRAGSGTPPSTIVPVRARRRAAVPRKPIRCPSHETRVIRSRPMCFDLDSRPPIAPIAGGALDGTPLMLTAADRNRFAAFRARAAEPGGAAVAILPDVRGLHPYYEELALRFAERGIDALAIDWFGRTAGPEPRDEGFDYAPHVTQTTWAGISADITAAVEELSVPDGDRPAPTAVFTLGFCMGGRMSFLAGTLGLDLAGVMGMYGTLVGPWRNDAPAPVDETA